MIYTEYQQVLLTQLQNNDKRIEEIKKEQEEIQGMFLQESKFKPGDLVQVDYKIRCHFRPPFLAFLARHTHITAPMTAGG